MPLVDAKILGQVILIQLEDDATVNDFGIKTYQEYVKCNPRDVPRRILFVKDNAGRMLSGDLKIIPNGLESHGLECIVENYSTSDHIDPSQVETSYRHWQLWSSQQLHRYVEDISLSTGELILDDKIYQLLTEIFLVPSIAIQLTCLKCFHLMSSRFPDEAVVLFGIRKCIQLFNGCEYDEVCIEVLTSLTQIVYHGLKHHSSSMLLSMYKELEFERVMLKFSTNQAVILRKYEVLIATGSNSSMLTRVEKLRPNLEPAEGDKETVGGKLIESSENVSEENNLIQSDQEHGSINDSSKPVMKKETIVSSSDKIAEVAFDESKENEQLLQLQKEAAEKFLSKLIGMISTPDIPIRIYGLTKLKHLLSITTPKEEETGALSMTKLSETDREVYLYELLRSPSESKRLIVALFAALKQSIFSRRKTSSSSDPPADEVFDHHASNRDKEKRSVAAAAAHGLPPAVGSTAGNFIHSESDATRLVDKALSNPKSDVKGVITILKCIYAMLVSVDSPIAKTGPFFSDPFRSLLSASAKDWLRLLLTLSHASDSLEIAEPAAAILLQIIINLGGWSRVHDLSIENIALILFLSCSICEMSSCRFELATSYFYFILDKPTPTEHHRGDFDPLKCDIIASIVFDQECVVLKAIVSWIQRSDVSVHLHVVAIRALSLLCQAKKFHDIMTKYGALRKLLTFLSSKCQYRRLDIDSYDESGLYRFANGTSDKSCGEAIGIDLGLVQLVMKSLSVLSTNLKITPESTDASAFTNLVKNILLVTTSGSQIKLADVVALDQIALFHYKLII